LITFWRICASCGTNCGAQQFPAKIAVEILGKPDTLKLLEWYVPDISRAKNELGLDVWIDLASGIQRTISVES